jgi:hypothetical protein
MWVEDGLAWGARIDIPDYQHGVFAGIGGNDDVATFVVGGG